MQKMSTTWMLRQNPCCETDQIAMMEWNKKEKIITCPFGHVPEASDFVDQSQFNTYEEEGNRSRHQDRKFVHDMKIGDIVIIPYKRMRRTLITRIESDVMLSKSFENMFVVYSQDRVVRVSSNIDKYTGSEYHIKMFRPVYRKISILMEVDRPQDIVFLPQSLCRAHQRMVEWANRFIQ